MATVVPTHYTHRKILHFLSIALHYKGTCTFSVPPTCCLCCSLWSHCLFYAAWKDDKPIDTIEVEAATGHLATPTATAQKSTVKESKLLVQSGSAAGIITKAIGRALPSCVFRQGKVTFISKLVTYGC